MSQLLNQKQLDNLMGDTVDFVARMLANHPDFSYLLAQSKRIKELEDENANLKKDVDQLTERLGGVRLMVTEQMYEELYQKHIQQEQELRSIALTSKQILDENIELKANAEKKSKQASYICASEETKEEIERLKTEAEKSRRINTELLILSNRQASDIRRLHVAGDAMADMAQFLRPMEGVVKDWNAAKEFNHKP